MIQLHIISRVPKQIRDIENLLINENFITGATVIDTLSSYKNEDGEIKTVSTNLLIGRTKASLFNTIEDHLKAMYGDKIPVIYGLPIVNMDFKHLEKLKKVIAE